MLCAGCATTVIAPQQVQDPVPVLLMDHGRTPSLVFPLDDDQQAVVRYAYGEYRYYAQAKRHLPGAMRALFWPTQAALGRRVMPGPIDPDHVRQLINVPVKRVYLIQVEREDVRRLRDDLDKLYRDDEGEEIFSAFADLTFVRHPSPYLLLSNSNHTIGTWLQMLGCEVRHQSVFSHWRVVQPSPVLP